MEFEDITKEEALYLFKETGRYDRALKLFEIASHVREDEIGNVFKLGGFMGLTTHCIVEPPCRHFLNLSTINISGFGPGNADH